jgi:hypothetical protein
MELVMLIVKWNAELADERIRMGHPRHDRGEETRKKPLTGIAVLTNNENKIGYAWDSGRLLEAVGGELDSAHSSDWAESVTQKVTPRIRKWFNMSSGNTEN